MKIFKVWNVNKTSGSLLGAQKLEELKMKGICIYAYIMQLEQILNRYDWNIILNIEFDIFKKKNVYSDGVMIICLFNICMCVKLPSLAYPRLLFKYWMHNENCIPIISFQSSISIQITHFNESFTSYCLGQLSHILKNKFILF